MHSRRVIELRDACVKRLDNLRKNQIVVILAI
jgi:hypothetical protein